MNDRTLCIRYHLIPYTSCHSEHSCSDENVHRSIERCRMMVGRWRPEKIKAGRFYIEWIDLCKRRRGRWNQVYKLQVGCWCQEARRWETLCRSGSWWEEENSSGWSGVRLPSHFSNAVLRSWQVHGRALGILATLESRDTGERTLRDLCNKQSMYIHI